MIGFWLVAFVVVGGVRVRGAAAQGDWKATQAKMDAASKQFHNARADFEWDYYERVVRDTTKQNGSIYFQRNGAAVQMGAVVRDGSGKPAKVIAYKDGQLQLFDPGVDQITQLKAGANQAQYESFLTLGFGGSGADLAKAWEVTDLGPEAASEGCATPHAEKLQLVSKDANTRNMFTRVTIWVDADKGVTLKQVFETPSGDKRTACYSNIKLNTKVDFGTFAIKKGKNTTVVVR
jgi:outer membrane lipoprotein-sorting protein